MRHDETWKDYIHSLMVVEGGQIEHFDKVTEEDQPAMLRFYDCTIFISYTLTCTEAAHDNAHEVVDVSLCLSTTKNVIFQSSKPCGPEQPSNAGNSEQDT